MMLQISGNTSLIIELSFLFAGQLEYSLKFGFIFELYTVNWFSVIVTSEWTSFEDLFEI